MRVDWRVAGEVLGRSVAGTNPRGCVRPGGACAGPVGSYSSGGRWVRFVCVLWRGLAALDDGSRIPGESGWCVG